MKSERVKVVVKRHPLDLWGIVLATVCAFFLGTSYQEQQTKHDIELAVQKARIESSNEHKRLVTVQQNLVRGPAVPFFKLRDGIYNVVQVFEGENVMLARLLPDGENCPVYVSGVPRELSKKGVIEVTPRLRQGPAWADDEMMASN
jgi:hypothetical protein